MKKATLERRHVPPDIPRELPHVCAHCGGDAPILNGAFYRNLRELAKLTLVEMGRVCQVGYGQLGRMERGEERFLPKYAALYLRLFERRRKAGDG